MANRSRARGLIPVRHAQGNPFNAQLKKMYVTGSDDQPVFVGDIVRLVETAAPQTIIRGEDASRYQAVAAAVSNTVAIVGVCVGIVHDPAFPARKHLGVGQRGFAMVCTDMDVIYQAEEDALGTPVDSGCLDSNIDPDYGAGNTTTGISGVKLDSSTIATGAGTADDLLLTIVGLVNRMDNDWNSAGAGSDPATLEVMFNKEYFIRQTASTVAAELIALI